MVTLCPHDRVCHWPLFCEDISITKNSYSLTTTVCVRPVWVINSSINPFSLFSVHPSFVSFSSSYCVASCHGIFLLYFLIVFPFLNCHIILSIHLTFLMLNELNGLTYLLWCFSFDQNTNHVRVGSFIAVQPCPFHHFL